MTKIEDRLTIAADRLRNEIDEVVDVEAALADTDARRRAGSPKGPTRWPLLLAAAAVLACVAAAGILLTGNDKDDQFVASEGPPTSPATDSTTTSVSAVPVLTNGPVPFDLLAETDLADTAQVGAMFYAGSAEGLAEPWAATAPGVPTPAVDFASTIVLGVTQLRHDPCGDHLQLLERDGTTFATSLAPDDGSQVCEPDHVARSFVFSVDRSELPPAFTLVLSAAPDGSYPERRLDVDLSTNGSVRPPDPADPQPEGNPDLRPAEVGNAITFSSVADISIGQVLDPSEVSVHDPSGPCGYWGPGEPSHDGDEPLSGISSSLDPAAPTAQTIMVRNPKYRTASGVGIGTTLSSLERIYAGLVVDRADGWESPTNGLLGSYQDVAAVANGDFALTFYLRDDIVETVKVSYITAWGDDEGCA